MKNEDKNISSKKINADANGVNVDLLVRQLFSEIVISNGMGAPSMFLLVLAAEGKLDSNISITGDTGSENDRLLNTGERMAAKNYYDMVIEPYAKDNKIHSFFVRSLDKNKKELTPIIDNLRKGSTAGVPLFGSDGGRLLQRCTSKYKIRATRQKLRELGYKKAQIALGLTYNEMHRMGDSDVKWCKNIFPLIDIGTTENALRTREGIYNELEKRSIPYIMTSECDMCPHKDWTRWERTSIKMIDELAEIENGFNGLYFTDKRVPLKRALKIMKQDYEHKLSQGELFEEAPDLCERGYCFL